ncbi:MAG: patatin-like phospholipase family protein [Candidatus Omnitrophica bacterium]|nr:patatin-like phospholipase family protein [Candidatus Omnitrophota bacterium]
MTALPSFFNKIAVIKQIPIFEGLNWFELNRIARKVELVEFNKGDVICKQEDPADAFYAVVSGRIYSYTLNPGGQKEEFDFILRGMHFGIISTLTGENHSHTYEAINDSVVIKIDKNDFSNLFKSTPKLAVALSQSLSRKIRSHVTGTRNTQESSIIAVYAPVKGSGSSTYAVNLALALKVQTDKKVLLLSLSSELSDPLINLADIVLDHQKIINSIQKDKLSIDILAVKFDSKDPGVLSRMSPFISAPVNDYNYIVFDLPNEMDDIILKTLVQSDIVHLVTLEREQDLESTRHVIDHLTEQLKDRFQTEKVQVIISGVKEEHELKPEEIKQILNYDVFLRLPHLKEEEFHSENVFEGFSIFKVDPTSEYAFVLQRLSRQISGSLIGLVLGGGAALGLTHVGIIRVLEKENIPIDIIIGSSMGALIGGIWAVGYKAEDIEKFAREFEKKSGMMKIFDPPFERALTIFIIMLVLIIFRHFTLGFFCMALAIPLAVPVSGLVRGEAIRLWLKEKLGNKHFHHTKIPFRAVAYDLQRRHDIVIDEGSLVNAICKSIAIPGVIRPIMENGQMIIDGGVLNPLPTNVLMDMGVKKIIAVNVLQSPQEVSYSHDLENDNNKHKARIPFNQHPFKYINFRLTSLIVKAFTPNIADIVVRTLQASEYVLAEASGKHADVLIHPDLKGINWFELYEAAQLIKRGEDAAIKHLASIKALVKR